METSVDGVVSGKNNLKPSKSSLLFFTTYVNEYQTRILIDTGATTTFIHQKLLSHLKNVRFINRNSYSFVLADGIAPFQVLGTVQLSICFANVTTYIEAHVAHNLCTNIIVGMDYINKYALGFDVKKQSISIEYQNRLLTMDIDSDRKLSQIPVVSSQSICIPPHSTRSTSVHISIASICSSLIPNEHLSRNNSLFVTHTLLNFRNYSSVLSLANTSPYPRYIRKGYPVGFLSPFDESHFGSALPIPKHTTSATTGKSGAHAIVCTSDVGNHINNITVRSFLPAIITRVNSPDINIIPSCNTIPSITSATDAHIQSLVKIIENTQYRNSLYSLLSSFSQTFDISKHNIAKTSIHHVINTIPHAPPACRPYPQPDKEQAMYQLMQEFLQAGLISESHSPYAAPAILIKKKDGSYRFVVDYKRLNLVTIKDSSPLPNMEDTLRKLGEGYNYFSKLDLKSGFYQIPIREADKEKTAFATPFGLYQFNVLPMGLKNSPPTFQKVMTDTLKSCRLFSLVYLDDIIVFSKSFEEHLHHLEKVLAALQAKSLVLNPPKCVFAVAQIDYLGHTVSHTKITPMKEKIQAILDIKEPRSLAQANKFIGSLNWYRKFIPNFASVAAPLHAVTNLTKDKRYKFKWKYAQSNAFHELKRMLVTAPLFLHYPVEGVPLILTTDASGIGIGGVLQQEVDGEVHNLYYHSQLMTPCERKYSAIEKEALAIYKCFARMRTFILGRNVILRTDHCPLCHIMEKTVRNARVDRITHLIQEFNIDKVIHIKGRENCLPDFLSRYSTETNDELFEIDYGLENKNNSKISDSSVTSIPSTSSSSQNQNQQNLLAPMVLRSHSKKVQANIPCKFFDHQENIAIESDNHSQSDNSITAPSPEKFSFNQFDLSKLKIEQENDSHIRNIRKELDNCNNNLPFILKDDLVYKLLTPSRNSKRKIQVIYVPSSMTKSLLQACHDDPMTGAHFSFDRTYNKLRFLYWWPNMKSTIKSYINSCLLCKQYNIRRHKNYGHLRSISPPEGPFQMIGIDYCGPLTRTPRENQYVLVITDYFTRHVTALALPNCTAETTAQTLFNDYFCKYGIPSVILSDQGSHFRNSLMENIKILIGYNHIYSTPYHPQTNGIVERFNATFVPQIAKLQDDQHNNWDEYLQAVVFAYNTGIHKSTQYSPYELLYGRPSRLPINIRPQHFSFARPNDYFEQLKKTLRIYHQAAHQNTILQQENRKKVYDTNRLDPQYKIGDKVITRLHGNKGKLAPKFSPIPKVITQVNHPVYDVLDEEHHISSQVHVADLRPVVVE